tara:strand:+ start:8807 stop:9961 length:1155 start_codon:yes stop_codon:yes gene_type:complete
MKLNYDYIICGGGASGLSLAFELSKDYAFKSKKILIIDPEYPKNINDRTWCFWEKSDNEKWENSIFHKWENILFKGDNFKKNISLNPLSYKMLKSKSFYDYVNTIIKRNPNIDSVNEKVIEYKDHGNFCKVKTESNVYETKKVFNSILQWDNINNHKKYPLLIQHFEGWFIKTKKDFFNPNEATFMDFTIDQNSNTKFIYTLPFSKNEALIEYTLFSKNVLSKKSYEKFLKSYLNKIGINEYSLISKESGKIPMTGYPFHKHNSKNILHIGSAGGWSKPSTGYTFKNIERNTKRLLNFLKSESDLRIFHKTTRFRYYDIIFLDVLFNNNHLGKKLFTEMFKNNKPKIIFKFLDEKSNIFEELRIMSNFSIGIFIKTIVKRFLKL